MGQNETKEFQSQENVQYTEIEQRLSDININTYFKWVFGGTQVYLTGSMTNWKDHILMEKVKNEYEIRLPPGVYQYKFIVDGDWCFSPDDEICTDENGNINNQIDTRNYQKQDITQNQQVFDITENQNYYIQKKNEEQTNQQNVTSQKDNQKSPKKKIKQKNKEEQIQINQDEDAPQLPFYLQQNNLIQVQFIYFSKNKNKYFINQSIRIFKIGKYLQFLTYLSKINSLKNPSINQLSMQATQKQNYSLYSLTHRHKNKYTTIKFYLANIEK